MPGAGGLMHPMMQQPKRRRTKEERDYEASAKEIERMKKECVKYENPDDYAKYGKMQR